MNDRAIYYNEINNETKVLIESCSFDNISTSSLNGATVHYVHQGEIVENKICAKNSQFNSKSAGIYSFHWVTSSKFYKNYIIESSFINCSSDKGNKLFCHYLGDVKCDKNNISSINAESCPCTFYTNIQTDAKVSFCSFNNNEGHSYNIFENAGDYKYFYSYCDIFSNNNKGPILHFSADGYFSSCNIFDNVDSSDYHRLFYIYGQKQLSCSKCYINNERASSNYPDNLIPQSVKYPQINRISVFGCNGEKCDVALYNRNVIISYKIPYIRMTSLDKILLFVISNY